MAENRAARLRVPAYLNGKPGGHVSSGVLVLADGSVFFGQGFGAEGEVAGTLVFDTRVMGFQEVLTDPASSGHILLFTFPHVGAAGCNRADMESGKVQAAGLVAAELPTEPSNWRSEQSFDDWLRAEATPGLAGADTRAITHHLRDHGSMAAVLAHRADGAFDLDALKRRAAALSPAAAPAAGAFAEGSAGRAPATPAAEGPLVAVVDFGVANSLLNRLAEEGVRVSVLAADKAATALPTLAADAIVLSHGPGDPATVAAGAAAVQAALASGKPVLALGLGHQLLAQSLGATIVRLPHGQHGVNFPVRQGAGPAFIMTSQNQDFAVSAKGFPAAAEIDETSLFDGTVQGFGLAGRPVFSTAHPPATSLTFPSGREEADSYSRFIALVKKAA